ncbi:MULTISPECIES: fumarylacetoacetate hydrolase family protein [Pseudofrankia]|uniref:fumarylacetoacetate hydrolase family protein n=1 Tax=Pseudofrankia TaxID=2994363 RepID=UPI000234B763|nr:MULTISPECIES: fumarylacetoacetate hydrolase family protein [Pseudofrankia]OHV30444.1 fumarylacetoacetate hydrolase [Pseudofrankia sp. EUN1h]
MLLGRALIGDTSCFGEVVDDRFHLLVGDVFGEYRRSGQSLPLVDVVLGAPLAGVRLIAVMGGFLEPGTSRPSGAEPMWVPKACNFVSGDGAEIRVPSALRGPVNVEAELAVVVGRPLSGASPAEAAGAIFGWSVFNDVTAAEYVVPGLWATAKSIDGFASWGPWIRRDLTEERVLQGLAITGTVNGVKVQSGNTRHYRFAPSEMLSHVSHRVSLFPGDVVTLGTPLPPPVAAVGDQIVCEVEEVGVLNNHLVAEG